MAGVASNSKKKKNHKADLAKVLEEYYRPEARWWRRFCFVLHPGDELIIRMGIEEELVEAAKEHGISGWIRSMPTGTIEGEVMADRLEAVEGFEALLKTRKFAGIEVGSVSVPDSSRFVLRQNLFDDHEAFKIHYV